MKRRLCVGTRYDVRKGDLFVLSCASERRCALVSLASVVFIVGAAVCSNLAIFLLLKWVVAVVLWMRFMFCLMSAGVTFLCVLMCMVYLVLLNVVCFLSLGVVCFVSG